MDTQKLLEAPKPKLKIVAKVSKINNLVEVSTQARKTSTSLRKTFEKGAYQRKTQLSVLNRYKKRLDSIQKEQEKKYEKQNKHNLVCVVLVLRVDNKLCQWIIVGIKVVLHPIMNPNRFFVPNIFKLSVTNKDSYQNKNACRMNPVDLAMLFLRRAGQI